MTGTIAFSIGFLTVALYFSALSFNPAQANSEHKVVVDCKIIHNMTFSLPARVLDLGGRIHSHLNNKEDLRKVIRDNISEFPL